jgi:hypothetical protein
MDAAPIAKVAFTSEDAGCDPQLQRRWFRLAAGGEAGKTFRPGRRS